MIDINHIKQDLFQLSETSGGAWETLKDIWDGNSTDYVFALLDRLEKKDTALQNCHMQSVKYMSELGALNGYVQDLEAALQGIAITRGTPSEYLNELARKALSTDQENVSK